MLTHDLVAPKQIKKAESAKVDANIYIDKQLTLGMTRKQLINKLGKPHDEINEGVFRCIKYEYVPENDPLISDTYVAEYYFRGDKLDKIRIEDDI